MPGKTAKIQVTERQGELLEEIVANRTAAVWLVEPAQISRSHSKTLSPRGPMISVECNESEARVEERDRVLAGRPTTQGTNANMLSGTTNRDRRAGLRRSRRRIGATYLVVHASRDCRADRQAKHRAESSRSCVGSFLESGRRAAFTAKPLSFIATAVFKPFPSPNRPASRHFNGSLGTRRGYDELRPKLHRTIYQVGPVRQREHHPRSAHLITKPDQTIRLRQCRAILLEVVRLVQVVSVSFPESTLARLPPGSDCTCPALSTHRDSLSVSGQASRWSLWSSHRSNAAAPLGSSAIFPKYWSLPRTFFAHRPVACGNRGKSDRGF